MFDFGLLPNQPAAFFGFQSDQSFDRRDLKRAYGKAIREYKPETHPQQFGQIREAYERLEKELRYGKQQEDSTRLVQSWQPPANELAPPPSPQQHSGKPIASDAKANLTLRQLAVVDPATAFKQLESKRRRTPQDYYLTAILTDATSGKATARFLEPLLEGLNAFPGDPGLQMLATEFLRTELPNGTEKKILRFIADKIRTPLFYQLTESLWTRLAQSEPFDEVSELLAEFEASLQQTSPETRATFYLQFLKSAIWTAPAAWTKRVLEELELRSADLDYQSQTDLEFLSVIQNLMTQINQQPLKDQVRKKLLRAIQLNCQGDEGATVGKVLQILSEIAGDAAGVQQAFPVPIDEFDSLWVELVYHMTDQLQNYLDEPEQTTPERLATQIKYLLTELEPTKIKLSQAASRGDFRYHWGPLFFFLFAAIIGGMIPVFIIATMITAGGNGGVIGLGLIGLFIGALSLFYRWLFPKFLRDRLAQLQHRSVMLSYAQHWRNRLFRFARSSSEPWETQVKRVQVIAEKSNRADTGETMKVLVRQDAGLAIFATLQTLLR